MKPHHEKAIQKLTESLKQKKSFLALIIAGSIAKGYERDDSDIDVFVVISDAEYERRKKSNRLQYMELSICDYPGGYIEGKFVNLDYIKTVAERGNEPARDAFRGAWIAFTKIPELENILKTIPVYQNDEKIDKMEKFYAQFEAAKWFFEEALKRNDTYLLTRAAADLVLFGGRLILAHNDMLYPFHKWFMKSLEEAQKKPENLLELINTFLNNKNLDNVLVLYNAIKNFIKWTPRTFWSNRFMKDTELAWLDGKPYVGDI